MEPTVQNLGFLGGFGSWCADRAHEFWSLEPAVKVTLVQTLLLGLAGLWAYRLFLLRREGQSSLKIDGSYRLTEHSDHRRLFLRLHIRNSSAVIVYQAEATISLLDAVPDPATGEVRLHLLSQEDPLLPINGEMNQGASDRITFGPAPGDLEPTECLQTEVMFVAAPTATLLAIRVTVTGSQGRLPMLRRTYDWGWFVFIDSLTTGPDYVSLSLHTTD